MRKIIYFLIGFVSVSIIFIFMLTTTPKIETVNSSSADFLLVNKDDTNKQRIEDIQGNFSSFLEYGSYQLEDVDYDYYERKEVIKYGKINPMFYFTNQVSNSKEENNGNLESNNLGLNSKSEAFTKCEDLNKVYPNGVTKDHAAYKANLDRDNDGIACDSSETPDSQVDNSGGVMKQEGKIVDNEKIDLNKPVVMNGFNVLTNVYEDKDAVVALKDFQELGKLPVDLEYYNVTSGFGDRTDPFNQTKAVHTGLDIAVPEINEKNVYSTSFGEIASVLKGDKGYGNHVIVKHNGYDTLYGHLSSIEDIKVGDKVYPGSILGKVGSTGRSTNPHLHFEVRVDNVTLDPTLFINKIRKVVK